MSFQGDVRGIGLAELLQGLGRGQKEGTLTLTAVGAQRAILGVAEGKAWLLPDPDEETEAWAIRARDAWAEDPAFELTAERLEPIAKAGRLETLYALLDGGGVHFRFDPGPLGDRTTVLAPEGSQKQRVHCPPTQIEFLLLEYARIEDEVELAGEPCLPHPDGTPCVTSREDLGTMPTELQENCDGSSTIQEIADRLAQPLRQVQLGLIKGIKAGGLRYALPLEQLHAAIQEMQRAEYSRAASRLTFWCREGAPGPLDPADADALTNEWLAGRLLLSLRSMEASKVRTLLRRLDATLQSPSHAVVHWTEALRLFPGDRAVRLHLAAARLRDEGDACGMDPREALDLARDLRDHHSPVCSGPALAIAAHLQPRAVSERLELGLSLLGASRVPDAAPWILTACTDMLAQGHADRLLAPLRTLLEHDPRHREARELLTRARRRSSRSKKLRRHATIGGAIALTFVAMGVTKLRSSEERRDRIAAIAGMVDRPAEALALLEDDFRTDLSVEILDLRMMFEDKIQEEEVVLIEQWDATFDHARQEAVEGEMLLALEMYRRLPEPPALRIMSRPWRSGTEILSSITERLRVQIAALGPPTIHAPRQITVERMVLENIEMLERALTDEEQASPMLASFRTELSELTERTISRKRTRSVERLDAEHARILKENDQLLELAHAALELGQFDVALEHYEGILRNDPAGKVRRVLEKEVAATRQKLDSVARARAAASRGEHPAALAILSETFEDPMGITLPWRVSSTPPGARVTVLRDGERTPLEEPLHTPFELAGTFADTWTLRFDLEGFDSRALVVRGPQDLEIALSRSPAVQFEVAGRVDAIPAPVGDGSTGDYIVCDRNGAIARVAWGGEIRWRLDIKDVSGIARRPVTLPGRQGQQLFVTETGGAWLLDPEAGTLQGPRKLEASPVFGPVVIGDEARALLRDGSVASWTSSLLPEYDSAPSSLIGLDESLRHGFQGLFTVQRPTGSESGALRTATADGGGWSIEIENDWYRVTEDRRQEEDQHEDVAFFIRRSGSWSYVAWEAPSIKGDPPVLWISDGLGLRAFLPPGTERTVDAR
ncbi:MAG: DUF4388 domain-containing protein [Planctomycetota bacterium]|nr:DUF4388 domain-containing protein [Planctomycetota bacterium]